MRIERPAGGLLLALVLAVGGVAFFWGEVAQFPSRNQALLFSAAIGLLLVYLVLHVDPAWLISGGIAASVFSGRWLFLGVNTPIGPDRVLIVAGVAAVLLRVGPSRDRPPLELRAVHFALAAAFAYALISMVMVETSGNKAALYALLDQYGLFPFLVFAVAPTVFRTARQRTILLGSLVATGAYLSLTALFEKLKLEALIWPQYITNPFVGLHYGRSRGPFAEAVANGLALYGCAVAAAIAFVTWRRPLHRGLAGAVCLLCLVGVQLTVTRAVWLGAIVASALVLVLAPPMRRFLVPAVVGGLCVVLGAFALVPGLTSQARDRQRDKTPIWERRNSNAAALRMIVDKPVIGFGWYRHNESAEPYFRNHPEFMLSGERAGMHNVFLTYAVGLGLLGFGLWLLAALLAFGGALLGRGPPELLPWRIGLGALVACYVVSGMAGPLAYLYPTMLAWTWAGVAFGARAPEQEPSPAPTRPGRRGPFSGLSGPLWGHDLERVPRKAA